MEPRAHHVVIGLFTVTAVAAALIFALWLAKSTTDREYDWFEVGFDRPVSGLSEGNPVQYSGIVVGDVVNLRLDTDDPRHVRALIRVYADVPVKEDTRAGLVLANITGSMSIQLQGGTPESDRLYGSRSNPPLIPAEPSPFSLFLESGEELILQLDQLLSNANRLFSEENMGNLSATFRNLESVSSALPDQQQVFGELMERMDVAALQVDETLTTWDALGKDVSTLIRERGDGLITTTESLLTSLDATARRLERLTADNEAAVDEGLQGLSEVAPAMRELRSSLRQLNRVIRRLEDNPADALLGREPMQEFNP